MFAVSGLAVHLFLGSWHSGLAPVELSSPDSLGLWLGTAINAGVFISKASLLVLVMMWLRWSLPRLRIDQVMMICLKYFLPISILMLVGVLCWQIWLAAWLGAVTRLILGWGSVLFCLGVFGSLLTRTGVAPRQAAMGVWQSSAIATRPGV
jgi:NADH-quinone oxidoreductase subunit H